MDTHEEIKKSVHYIENAQQHAQPNMDVETAPYMEVVDPEHTDHINQINDIIKAEHPGQVNHTENINATPPVENYTPDPESERQLDPSVAPKSADSDSVDVKNPAIQTDSPSTQQRSIMKGVLRNVLMPVEAVFYSLAGAVESYITKPLGSSSNPKFNGRTTVSEIAQIAPTVRRDYAEQDSDPKNVVQFPAQVQTNSELAAEPVPDIISQFPTQLKEVQHAA